MDIIQQHDACTCSQYSNTLGSKQIEDPDKDIIGVFNKIYACMNVYATVLVGIGSMVYFIYFTSQVYFTQKQIHDNRVH